MKLGRRQHVTMTGMMLLWLLFAVSAEAAECTYASKVTTGNRQPELTAQGRCGEFVGQDEFRISPEHLSKLVFRDSLAVVLVDDKAFYVAKSGKAARVHVFENGADYFSEGLARTISQGKFGYIDRKLTVVIKPEYDFAFPFRNSRAIVCTGCVTVAEGEHRAVKGGTWGLIDKTGAIVIPVRYTKEELEKLRR
jgi:hypothetical protein